MLSLHYMKRKPHDLKNSLERIRKYNWYQNSRVEKKTTWGRGTSPRLHVSVLVAVWRIFVFRFIWKPGRVDQTYDVKTHTATARRVREGFGFQAKLCTAPSHCNVLIHLPVHTSHNFTALSSPPSREAFGKITHIWKDSFALCKFVTFHFFFFNTRLSAKGKHVVCSPKLSPVGRGWYLDGWPSR